MRILYSNFKMLFLLTACVILQISVVYAQTYTVNYNISAWNITGSLNVNIGTTTNVITNQAEGFIRITFPDGEVVEVTPQVINAIIQGIENNSNPLFNDTTTVTQEVGIVPGELDKLKELKSLLEDQTRMESLINQMQSNSVMTEFNWDYTLQTIRSLQVQVTGTLH